MPERYTFIPNGGLNQSGALTDAAQHECVDGANIIVTPGGFKPRAGRVLASRVPNLAPATLMSGGAISLAEYVYQDTKYYVGQFDDPAVVNSASAGGGLWFNTDPTLFAAASQIVLNGNFTVPVTTKVRMAQVGDSLLVCNRTATGRILRCFSQTATPTASWELVDETVPVYEPVWQSSTTGGSIPGGLYFMNASFGITKYGVTSESNTGPTMSRTLADDYATLTVRVSIANVGGSVILAAGDVVYLYAMGVDSDSWLRIASHVVVSPTDITNKYVDITVTDNNGTLYPSTITPLPSYMSRPPAGCDGVVSYLGRAIYWKGRRIYISNDNDPTRMPLLPYDDTDSTYGGWVDIGNAGNVTGIGIQDGYALVFKANETHLLSGEPGVPQFGLRQISGSVGCVSHESIAACESMLLWCGPVGVWAFDGQKVDEIGKNINPKLRADYNAYLPYTFAVYDPVKRWYRLTVGVLTVEDFASAYVFDFSQAIWYPRFTNQPNTCALYAQYAITPGIYASNMSVVGSDPGAIYLLDSGGQDQLRSTVGQPDAYRAITWSRVSREEIPDPLFLTQVHEVTVWGHGTTEDTADTVALTMTLYQDEEATIADVAFARSETWNAQRSTRGSVGTRFPQNRNTSHRIGLSGVHSWAEVAAQEIRRIQVAWSPRGRNSR